MTVPFNARIQVAASDCYNAMLRVGADVSGTEVGDVVVIVARGESAKALRKVLADDCITYGEALDEGTTGG